MSVQVDGSFKTFPANAVMGAYIRVKLEADGGIDIAGVDEKDIGTTEEAALAIGDKVRVRLRNAPGTRKNVAAGAVAVAADVYTAADGEVNDVQADGSYLYGTAMSAAGADQDIIEVLPNVHGDTPISV